MTGAGRGHVTARRARGGPVARSREGEGRPREGRGGRAELPAGVAAAPCKRVVGDAEEALVGKTWDGRTGDGPSAAWRKRGPGKEGLPRSSARWERCRRRSAVPAPGNPAGRLGRSPHATSAGRNATLEALIPDPVLAKLSFARTTRAECGAIAHTPRAGGRAGGARAA